MTKAHLLSLCGAIALALSGGLYAANSQPAPTVPATQKMISKPSPKSLQSEHHVPAVAHAPVAMPSTSSTAAVPHPAASTSQPAPFVMGQDDSSFFQDEAGLQRQIRLLTLRAKVAELRTKLEGDAAPPAPQGPSIAVLPPPMTPARSTDPLGTVASLSLPDHIDAPAETSGLVLVSVMGIAGRYQAVLTDRNTSVTVEPGSVLSDGWRVSSIDGTSVSLSKGRSHKTIRMGG